MFRVLQRREQVLKVSCNHLITSDMKLNPMATSETSWCWVANDLTEGEPTMEQFAAKFKVSWVLFLKICKNFYLRHSDLCNSVPAVIDSWFLLCLLLFLVCFAKLITVYLITDYNLCCCHSLLFNIEKKKLQYCIPVTILSSIIIVF